CSQDGAPDRLTCEGDLLQPVPDEIIRRILGSSDLLYDHILLASELLGIECRIGENIGQYVERERNVRPQYARVVRGGFDRSGRIEIAADRFDLFRDLPGAAPRRALERHMLEQMGDAVLIRPLVAAAGTDPHAERGGLEMRHPIRHHHEAGGKTGHFNAHAAAPAGAARLYERMCFSTAP